MVIPLYPPALSPPVKALGAEGGQAGLGVRSKGTANQAHTLHQRSSASISGPVWVFISEYQCPSAVQKTALRAVGPLYPPALSPPVKALEAKGGQAGLGVRLKETANQAHTLHQRSSASISGPVLVFISEY